jgi:ABC-type phosphate transport system substrate-binding protein
MALINRIGWLLVGLALSLASAAASADVVAVVSAESPVAALSKAQVADIFLGKATRFPDGTKAMPIDQAEGSAVRDEFYDKVAGKSAAQIKAYWSKIIFTGRGQPPPNVSDAVEMKKRLVENPAAIGYIDRDSVDESVRIVLF